MARPVIAIPIGAAFTGGRGPWRCTGAWTCGAVLEGGLEPKSLLMAFSLRLALSLFGSTLGGGTAEGEAGAFPSLDAPQPMVTMIIFLGPCVASVSCDEWNETVRATAWD
jgi:hypothetical protein